MRKYADLTIALEPMPYAALPPPCETPNAEARYRIRRTELPAHCPTDRMCLWNSHPRVYLPLEHTGDEVRCPYCGALYTLID